MNRNGTVKPLPNALNAFPSWIRRSAAPIAVVTLTYLGRENGARWQQPTGSEGVRGSRGTDLVLTGSAEAEESEAESPALKTSTLNFEAKQYTSKVFNGKPSCHTAAHA
ncbi:hypothetical protein GCM10010219_45600 [Streptomyces netropsis]|nr:hypothetical protein GCM10010219_45600 [Streptomyces netropsis]